MPSIANIPEPTTAYRPIDVDQPVIHAPLGMRPMMESGSGREAHETDEHSVVSWLVMMVGGGLVMRVGLLYFGALREVPASLSSPWADLGQQLTQDPASAQTAWPLFAVLASTAQQLGLPAWFVVMLGVLLSAAAIPATYTLGRFITGRVVAGLIAAAIVAFHPAVLTAAGLFGPGALTLALATLGLALIILTNTRGPLSTLPGAGLLALASLTSPLAWAVIPLGAVLAAQTKSIRHGLSRALFVLVIAAAPAVGWFACFGHNPLLPPHSLSAWPAAGSVPAVAQTAEARFSEKLIYAVSNHSLPQLGQAVHAQIISNGPLTRELIPALVLTEHDDPVADALGDGWVLLNLALFVAAGISIGLMGLRGRAILAAALALPLLALMVSSPLLGEAGRTGLIGVQAILAVGLFATRPAPRWTEQELAARELERIARREAKEQAKLAKAERSAKKDIYAFDTGERRASAERRDRRDRRDRRGRADGSIEDRALITTEQTIEPPAPVGRPI